MECEIYIEQPEGYEVKSQSNEKLVYKLEKSLYGLKQADTGMECCTSIYVKSSLFKIQLIIMFTQRLQKLRTFL